MKRLNSNHLTLHGAMKVNTVSAMEVGPLGCHTFQFSEGMNVITGINGSGKTIILKTIYDSTKFLFARNGIDLDQTRLRNKSARININISFGAGNVIDLYYPALNPVLSYTVKYNNEDVEIDGESPAYLNAFRYEQGKTCPLVYISSERGNIISIAQQPTQPNSYRSEDTSTRFSKIRLLFDLIHEQNDDFDVNLNAVLTQYFPNFAVFIKSRNQLGTSTRQTDVQTIKKKHEIGSSAAGCIEVLFIVAETCGLNGSIILIDEPELHLHPKAQDMLVKYLNYLTTQDGGSNQVILATHSLSMIYGSESARIINIKQGQGGNQPEIIYDKGKPTKEFRGAVENLGYSPEAMQSSKKVFDIYRKMPGNEDCVGNWMGID